MTDQQWKELLQIVEAKQRDDDVGQVSLSKTKTVTLNSPNSSESSTSAKFSSNHTEKPIRGILRASVDIKIDAKEILKNEIFQTDKIQKLVNKLCD